MLMEINLFPIQMNSFFGVLEHRGNPIPLLEFQPTPIIASAIDHGI